MAVVDGTLEAREQIHEGDALVRADKACLLYTSDAADERSRVDLGGRRIITKKKQTAMRRLEDETNR